jgi:hypothetical protein
MYAAAYSPAGTLTWVGYNAVLNQRVVGRRIVGLGA